MTAHRTAATAVAFTAALFAPAPVRAADPAPVVLCDFDKGEPADGWTLEGVRASATDSPNGRGLKLTTEGRSPIARILRSFESRDWRRFKAVSMRVRVEGEGPSMIRVCLTSTDSTARLVRDFKTQSCDWTEVVLPLADFRDDGYDHAGSFARVDQFSLETMVLGSDAEKFTFSIDDLVLLPGDRGAASCARTPAELRQLAFGDAKARTLESEHFVLVDDIAALRNSDAKKLLARLEEGLKVLGDRYGVTGDLDDKVPFLLFATHIEYEKFVAKLGEQFGEKLKPQNPDGFSRYGMAVSWFDEKQGWDRPAYVHEAMHGVIQRRLGLIANGNWVQEGLAAAVAARLYPASLDRKKLAESFAKRSGDLAPWLDAIDDPIARTETYTQLLTIMDFLAEKHRDGLPKTWDAVRALREPLYKAAPFAIAKTLDTDVATLEKEWFAWGAKFYGGK